MSKNSNKKKFYKLNQVKASRDKELKEGISGFLVMCNKNKEKQSLREVNDNISYAINRLIEEDKINEYINKESLVNNKNNNNNFTDINLIEDIDSNNINKKEIKEQVNKEEIDLDILKENLNNTKILFNFEINKCRDIIFLKVNKDFSKFLNITKLTEYMFNNAQNYSSKGFTKIFPIQIAVKASILNVNYSINYILNNVIKLKDLKSIKYKIEYRCRNNNSIQKSDVFNEAVNILSESIVDFSNPDIVIFIDVCNDLMSTSIYNNYEMLSCYNLIAHKNKLGINDCDNELNSNLNDTINNYSNVYNLNKVNNSNKITSKKINVNNKTIISNFEDDNSLNDVDII